MVVTICGEPGTLNPGGSRIPIDSHRPTNGVTPSGWNLVAFKAKIRSPVDPTRMDPKGAYALPCNWYHELVGAPAGLHSLDGSVVGPPACDTGSPERRHGYGD